MTLEKAKIVRIPAMRSGLCGYEDETVYLSNMALERMNQTAKGIPVFINHIMSSPLTVENEAVGRVVRIEKEVGVEDLYVAEIVVEDEEAYNKLSNGWGVSTAYHIKNSGRGGTFNNIPYEREVLDAEYDHLAIVESPRYEMARDPFFLNSCNKNKNVDNNITTNISTKGDKGMLKFFRNKREEIKVNEGEELYVEVNGKEVKLNEMLALVEKEEAKKQILENTAMIEVAGKQMSVLELISKYEAICNAKNGKSCNESDIDVANESEEEEKKENEDSEESKEEKDNAADSKDNSVEEPVDLTNFNSLKAANEKSNMVEEDVSGFLTLAENVALNKKKYGSGN